MLSGQEGHSTDVSFAAPLNLSTETFLSLL